MFLIHWLFRDPSNERRMMSNFTRSNWTNEFSTPTVDSLRGDIEQPTQALFDQARTMFMDLEEIEEGFCWYGECWHWAITFSLADHEDDTPLGIIIPSPEDLQVAMPMDQEFHASVPTKRMKRMIKDGFELAADPFHTSWAVWSISTTSMLTDIGQLAKQKLRWILDNH